MGAAGHVAKLFDGVSKAASLLSALSLLIIVAAVGLQVVSRFVFNSPMTWTQEAALFALVWLTFIGIVALAREKAHIGLQFGQSPGRHKLTAVVWKPAISTLSMLVAGTLAVVAWQNLDTLGAALSPAMRISMAWVYLPTIIGFGLWSLSEAFHLVDGILNRRWVVGTEGPAHPGEHYPG